MSRNSPQFDAKPPVGYSCPLCGDRLSTQSDHDKSFVCGTEYCGNSLHQQGERCKANSFTVTRREATILGIMEACDPPELEALVYRLNVKLKLKGLGIKC